MALRCMPASSILTPLTLPTRPSLSPHAPHSSLALSTPLALPLTRPITLSPQAALRPSAPSLTRSRSPIPPTGTTS